jgi:hypothetical protein
MSTIPNDPNEQIKDDIFNGRKIDAIKKYRAITREGLKESKDFIEALEVELRATSPEKFTVPPGRKGCGAAVLCVVLIVVIASALA